MFKKRLFAYFIDVLILNVILSLVSMFIPTSENIINLNNEFNNINNSYIDGTLDIITYVNRYANISYNMDKELFLANLLGVVISICYFVVYPLYNKGQSIGKKILGLRIVSEENKITANGLIFRYLLMDGIGTSIISMCLIFILKDLSYVISVSVLSFLQFVVVISSIFMVLYRRDKKSLPDLIAGTKVIEVEK